MSSPTTPARHTFAGDKIAPGQTAADVLRLTAARINALPDEGRRAESWCGRHCLMGIAAGHLAAYIVESEHARATHGPGDAERAMGELDKLREPETAAAMLREAARQHEENQQ